MSRLEEIKESAGVGAGMVMIKQEEFEWLISRVEELERLEKSFDELDSDYIDTKKENEALAETRRLDAVENVRLWEENQRYKQALEYTQSELEYAHVTGNMNLRNDLIKKSLKAIDKALAGDNS